MQTAAAQEWGKSVARGAERRRVQEELRAAMPAEQEALQSDIAGPSDARRGSAAPHAVAAMAYDYDLFVIGAGSGGVRAARRAAAAGARVAIAEVGPRRRHLRHPRLRAEEAAGLCLALPRGVRGQRLLRLERRARPTFDWPTLIANKDKEIARLEGVYRANLEKAGAELIETPRRPRRRTSASGSSATAAPSPPSTS